jgi:hypothetical protein
MERNHVMLKFETEGEGGVIEIDIVLGEAIFG